MKFHTRIGSTSCVLQNLLGAFPCFSRFRGGKGFATMSLCVIALNPFIALILLCIYIPLVAMTRYISLGSVVIALFYPIILHSLDTITMRYGVPSLFALMIAALVTWAHRANLKRIMDRTERKIKLWHKTPEAPAVDPVPESAPEEVDQLEADRFNADRVSSTKKHPVSKKKLKRLKKRK